jgi:DNA repair exonuclease SbcCD ATPase subunit
VSQDYIAVLEQLEPFFDEVGAAIDEQAELVDRFNGIMGDFGFGITPPVDRLLTEADIDEMREQRQQLADEFSDLRSAMEALQDEIEALMDELNDLLSGMDEGDPFAGERIQELADELQELFDTIDAEGCLP